MTGLFIQVRLDSSRLPRKAVLDLGGRTVIEHVMAALKPVDADVFALLTDEFSSSVLEPLAEGCGYKVFSGDKEDVLKRYADAALFYGVDTVIRATGDNPLLSGLMTQRILEIHKEADADFSCFVGLPLGTGVEVDKTSALLYAAENAVDPYEREHVNPYLYRREDKFKINKVPAPGEYSLDARVTLDTEEDYRYLSSLFADLYRGAPVEIDTLVPYLRKNMRENR